MILLTILNKYVYLLNEKKRQKSGVFSIII